MSAEMEEKEEERNEESEVVTAVSLATGTLPTPEDDAPPPNPTSKVSKHTKLLQAALARGEFSSQTQDGTDRQTKLLLKAVKNFSAPIEGPASLTTRQKAKVFFGAGKQFEWTKAGDEEEEKGGNKFVAGQLQHIFEQHQPLPIEESDPEDHPINEDDAGILKKTDEAEPQGSRLDENYVFIVEVLSNRHLGIIVFIVYLVFFVTIGLSGARFEAPPDAKQFAALVECPAENGIIENETELTCYYQGNGECVPDQDRAFTAQQASLLATTFIVSDGIETSDWDYNGARQGTPPFSTYDYTRMDDHFMACPSVLDFEANSELHPFWDDIAGVFWFSFPDYSKNVETIQVSFRFEKLDGDWPANITDTEMTFAIDSFLCARGGDDFCDSVGSWREFRTSVSGLDIARTNVDGNVFTVSLGGFLTGTDKNLFKAITARIVATADPEGAITDCIRGNNCITSVNFQGSPNYPRATTYVIFITTVFFFFFFVWWIRTLYKRRGAPLSWPRENWWLVMAGVGILLETNFLSIVLFFQEFYDDSFRVLQGAWAASIIFSSFGRILEVYTLACFTDSPRRYVVSKFTFHKYKILHLTILLVCIIVTTLYEYPAAIGLDQPGTDTIIGGVGLGTPVDFWNDYNQTVYTVFLVTETNLIILGLIYFFWKCHVGFRVLDALPYGLTRHTQLSFRFFFFATSLWVVAFTAITLYNIFANLVTSSENLNKRINQAVTLPLQLSYTSFIFKVCLFVIMQIFFLPPRPEKVAERSKTHHISDEEAEEYRQSEGFNRKYLMVLDQALLLATCSNEVYLPVDDDEAAMMLPSTKILQREKERQSQRALTSDDVKKSIDHDVEQPISSDPDNSSVKFEFMRLAGDQEPGRTYSAAYAPDNTYAMGCRVVARIFESGKIDLHDTRAVIFRHEFSDDLIVAFRGTATTKQVKTDVMINKIGVNLDTFVAAPKWKSALSCAPEYARALSSSEVEKLLLGGKIPNVRLIDLIPSDDEELPPYLKGASKSGDSVEGICQIHFGFWSSYNRVRQAIHERVREELLKRPGRLILTGHSLGGAQATLCAYDMSRWVIPTLKQDILKHQKGGRSIVKKLHLSCYTFGSPRVGGPVFAKAFKEVVPDAQRIICDGDVITSGPPGILGYYPVGRDNIFDFTGTIRTAPSLMEKKFSLKKRNKASSHFMANYLANIKKAYHPKISQEQLVVMIKDAYGMNKGRKCLPCR
uniref:Fungal lipase-type domain-containing protein n=1 Tax=Ditylum brightwellii TaxID=49249 RepID=A0A7S1ZTK1_9STRA|mmetsp:Transcript_38247/g.57249  ORF Transcript_38247/g.57249 Transcript_38247/m.57249 type:complete len:1219 (+) Transcript_38247:105-3761(+)